MTRLISWATGLLIPGWLDDGSPPGWRSRLISWAWWQDDQRAMGDQTWREDAPEPRF
jgi:hypothetical protein